MQVRFSLKVEGHWRELPPDETLDALASARAAAALSSPLEILAEPRNAEDMVDQAGRRKREGRRFQTPEDLDDIVFGGDGGLTLSCFSRHEDR